MPYIKDKNKLEFARRERRVMTWDENYLWYEFLRYHKYKFRKQHVIEPFIADFYCAKVKLAVELDGGHHYEPEQEEYDKRRTKFFEKQGITVLRIDNYFVRNMFEYACEMIDEKIEELLNN